MFKKNIINLKRKTHIIYFNYFFKINKLLMSKMKKKNTKKFYKFISFFLKLNFYKSIKCNRSLKKKVINSNIKISWKSNFFLFNFFSHNKFFFYWSYFEKYFFDKNIYVSFFPTKKLTFVNHKKVWIKELNFFVPENGKKQHFKFFKNFYFKKRNLKKTLFNILLFELFSKDSSIEKIMVEITTKYFSKTSIILVKCAKVLLFGFSMVPVAFGALGSGMLFGLFNIASSKNPEEGDKLYGNTLVAFALIETFIFLGIIVCVAVSVIL